MYRADKQRLPAPEARRYADYIPAQEGDSGNQDLPIFSFKGIYLSGSDSDSIIIEISRQHAYMAQKADFLINSNFAGNGCWSC
jgi:hypothetical protein